MNAKTTRRPVRLVGVLICLIVSGPLVAQPTGTLRGRIVDAGNGQPLIGAGAAVREAKVFAEADLDGKFQMRLPPGEHTVVFQMAGFAPVTRRVTIRAGAAVDVTVSLGVQTAKQTVIRGRAVPTTEAAILAIQRKAGSVSDGVSAEAIKKSPDSSAGDVLKRVTGISIIDGRFIFVRGLGERYSSTMLNGSLLPSPEPGKRVVPMDIFPAGLIKNIRVIKTFLPEDPAEFSGGLVKIETKEYPDEFVFDLGFGIGGNANTTGRHFLEATPKGGQDYLGRNTGRRDPPELVDSFPDTIPFREGNAFGGIPANVIRLGATGFNNDWAPRKVNAPFDRKLTATVGDSVNFGRSRFGYLLGTSYDRKWRKKEVKEYRYEASKYLESPNYVLLFPLSRQDSKVYEENVLWGNNINLAFEPIPGQRFYSKTLISYLSDRTFRQADGEVSYNRTAFKSETNGYVSRELIDEKIGGVHALRLSEGRPHKFWWHYSYSEANRSEPDLKQSLWTRNQDSTDYAYRRAGGPDGSRFFGEASDRLEAVQGDYELPFNQWSGLNAKAQVGALAQDRTKDFRSKTYTYQRLTSLNDADVWPMSGDAAFHPARVWSGDLRFEQRTTDFSHYDALHKLHAYYGQVDMPLMAGLRFIGGVRYEDSYQFVRTYNPFLSTSPINDPKRPGIGEVATKDTLPSANFVWEYSKKNNLRLAYTETITRPDLRELSEFGFSSYFGEDRVFGNPRLRRTYIHNYDARWEYYISQTDYVGVAGFLKELSKPIETVGQATSGSSELQYTFTNARRGQIRGLEFDARRDFLTRFRIEFNLYLIRSEVEIFTWEEREFLRSGLVKQDVREASYDPSNLTRRLQGQSDQVYNVKLQYFLNPKKTHSLGLFYNAFSDRIEAVGANGAPDTIEKGAALVDFVYELTALEDRLIIKAAAKNITDTRFKSTVEDPLLKTERLYRSYRKGVEYTASATYKF